MTINSLAIILIALIIGLWGYTQLRGPSPELLYMQSRDLQKSLSELDRAQRLFEATSGPGQAITR